MLVSVLRNNIPRLWLLVLLAINWLTYRGHYDGVLSFPFDFGLTYYGFVAFWVTAVQHGVFPEWVPYQAYGYPLLMNPQAYLFYAPNWFFVLTGVKYSGYAHTVLQCLHVLFGSVGFFFLARRVLNDLQLALLGAIIFHFFGGFFSNSEHPDIVRGFAFCPWLIWSLYIHGEQRRLEVRNWLLPLVLYAIGTGAYPGQVVASFFLGAWYLVFLAIVGPCGKAGGVSRANIMFAFQLFLLFCVGLVLAAPQLYSGVIFSQLTTRGQTAGVIAKWGWDLRLLPLLMYSWDRIGLPYDSVMTSMFIGIPAFMGLFFLSGIKRAGLFPWMFVVLLAITLITGPASIFYRAWGELIAPMVFSRFPGTDYRGFIGVFLVIGALLGFRRLVESPALSIARSPGIVALISVMCVLGGITGTAITASECLITLVILAVFYLLVVARARYNLGKGFVLGALGLIILWNAYYVIWGVPQHWKAQSLADMYRQHFGIIDDSRLPVSKFFKENIPARPHRTEEVGTLAWVGYLDGTFHTNDYTGLVMSSRHQIESIPALKKFMMEPWRPILLSDGAACRDLGSLIGDLNSTGSHVEDVFVKQLSYGIDYVEYELRGSKAFSFIENESYFPGWRGSLVDATGNESKIVSRDCSGLRRWDIPDGGVYRLKTRFEFPYLRGIISVWAVVAIAYLGFSLSFLLRRFGERFG